MNKQIERTITIMLMLIVLASLCLLLNFLKVSAQKQQFEDQFIICNYKNVCQLINSDNYINPNNLTKLWFNFNHDLDTFNLSEIDP